MTRHVAWDRIAGVACCTLLTVAIAIGCDKGSPIAPDPFVPQPNTPDSVVTALRIEGNLQLAGLNETTQLRGWAAMSTGPERDVSALATWQIKTGGEAVTVSDGGLIRSVRYGTDVVTVTYRSVSATASVRVMPPGMHGLSGFVREAPGLPVSDALVEVVDGPSAGRSTTTDPFFGRFNLSPVGGAPVTVRVSKRDYETTTWTLAMDTDLRDVVLPLVPRELLVNLAGVYDLTIDASPICQLPEELRRRRYQATIGQDGARLDVTLSGTTFRPCYDNLGQADHFVGRVSPGNVVAFELGRDDRGCKQDVYERISPSSYFELSGSAAGTASDRQITLTLTAVLALLEEPQSGRAPAVLASCYSTHRMTFERRTPD